MALRRCVLRIVLQLRYREINILSYHQKSYYRMLHIVDNQVSKYFGLLVILNAFQRLSPQYMCSAMPLVSTNLPCVWFEIEEFNICDSEHHAL